MATSHQKKEMPRGQGEGEVAAVVDMLAPIVDDGRFGDAMFDEHAFVGGDGEEEFMEGHLGILLERAQCAGEFPLPGGWVPQISRDMESAGRLTSPSALGPVERRGAEEGDAPEYRPEKMSMATSTSELKANIIAALRLEEIEPDQIDDNAPLFGEGLSLDSIDALELVAMLEKDYSIVIKDIEEGRPAFQSVRSLADYIDAKRAS